MDQQDQLDQLDNQEDRLVYYCEICTCNKFHSSLFVMIANILWHNLFLNE